MVASEIFEQPASFIGTARAGEQLREARGCLWIGWVNLGGDAIGLLGFGAEVAVRKESSAKEASGFLSIKAWRSFSLMAMTATWPEIWT